MADDTVGCLAAAAILIFGGYWAYTHYEIRKLEPAEGDSDLISTTFVPPRPSGMIVVTETKSGSIWRLNADSVRGDRQHRQGWVIVDSSKDKTAPNWRFHHSLYLVDCDTTAIRELSSIFYKADGTSPWPPQSVDASKAEPSYFPDGTVGYAPIRALCGPEFDAPNAAPSQ